jgi:hypothetical protein
MAFLKDFSKASYLIDAIIFLFLSFGSFAQMVI